MDLSLDMFLARVAQRVRAIAVTETVPVVTGELRRSIHVTKKGDYYIVGTNKVYARRVHDGSGQIVIKPKSRKALKFQSGGKTYYRKKVVQPPRKGKPFFRDAIRQFTDNADRELAAIAPELSKEFRKVLAYELKKTGAKIS